MRIECRGSLVGEDELGFDGKTAGQTKTLLRNYPLKYILSMGPSIFTFAFRSEDYQSVEKDLWTIRNTTA